MVNSTAISKSRPWALVTGGAIRVGKLIALELAQLGFNIVIHYFQAEKESEATVNEIQTLGVDSFAIQADLRHPDEISRMFHEIGKRSRPAILVNSAAVMPSGKMTAITLEEWQDVMDLNLRAPLLCTREAVKIMPPGSTVINIGDEFSSQTWKEQPLYGLSKSSLVHLTRILAAELAPDIKVAGLALGPVLPPDQSVPEIWDKIVRRSASQMPITADIIGQALEKLIKSDNISGKFLTLQQLFDETKH